MPETPLTDREPSALRRWERTQFIYASAFIGFLTALIVLERTSPFTEALPTGLGIGMLLLALFGVRHRLGLRCPRCGFHLGRAFRFRLPRRCPRCSVSLKPST
jgi:hypothetical protein